MELAHLFLCLSTIFVNPSVLLSDDKSEDKSFTSDPHFSGSLDAISRGDESSVFTLKDFVGVKPIETSEEDEEEAKEVPREAGLDAKEGPREAGLDASDVPREAGLDLLAFFPIKVLSIFSLSVLREVQVILLGEFKSVTRCDAIFSLLTSLSVWSIPLSEEEEEEEEDNECGNT